MSADIVLHLTDEEAAALEAVTAGVGQLAERQVSTEAAVVGALDHCLSRLLEDFELPDAAVREQVGRAQQALRDNWTRGNACL